MIEEIIYTSAEKGLKAGSRGFCTVVSTAGMAINMAERLESMSGYRHAFPIQSPQAVLNPINHSHVTMRIGGKLVHVLSRIADAGQDYSGRTNKLAHHLAMDDVSRFVSGPARLMEQSGVLVTSWDGQVRTTAPRNVVGAPMPSSVTLSAWKRVTGDSGWAGWVAEQLSQDKAPVSVIFAAGTETLLLVREVLDLLPPSQRWGVTFSTYFTKLLAGTECQLRFVLDDTPEATALRNDARAKVVDLLRKNPPAIGGTLVQQARTELIQLEPSAPSPKPVAKPQASSSKPPVRSAERTTERTTDEDSDTYRMSKPSLPGAVPSRPSLPPRLGDRVFDTPEAPSLRRFEMSREKKNRTPLITGAVAVLMFCAGVGLTVVIFKNGATKSGEGVANASPTNAERNKGLSGQSSETRSVESEAGDGLRAGGDETAVGLHSGEESQMEVAATASTEGTTEPKPDVSRAPQQEKLPAKTKGPFDAAADLMRVSNGGFQQLLWPVTDDYVDRASIPQLPVFVEVDQPEIKFEVISEFFSSAAVQAQNAGARIEISESKLGPWNIDLRYDESSSKRIASIKLLLAADGSLPSQFVFEWVQPTPSKEEQALLAWAPLLLSVKQSILPLVLHSSIPLKAEPDSANRDQILNDGFWGKGDPEVFGRISLSRFEKLRVNWKFGDQFVLTETSTKDLSKDPNISSNHLFLSSDGTFMSVNELKDVATPFLGISFLFKEEQPPDSSIVPMHLHAKVTAYVPAFTVLNPDGTRRSWNRASDGAKLPIWVNDPSFTAMASFRESLNSLGALKEKKRDPATWWRSRWRPLGDWSLREVEGECKAWIKECEKTQNQLMKSEMEWKSELEKLTEKATSPLGPALKDLGECKSAIDDALKDLNDDLAKIPNFVTQLEQLQASVLQTPIVCSCSAIFHHQGQVVEVEFFRIMIGGETP